MQFIVLAKKHEIEVTATHSNKILAKCNRTATIICSTLADV
jgi:hypothetical protein